MFLSKFSVKRPVSIVMIVLIVIILGVVSLTRIPTDLFPSFNIPVVAVSTTYYGASPSEVESIVTKNLEDRISTVSNIKSVTSISSEHNSLIIAEFESDTDMDAATLEVRDQLDLVSPYLPDGVSSPVVMKFNPNMMPIMGFAATKEDASIKELTSFMEDTFVPRIERIEGVASVSLTGTSTSEIAITTNDETLSEYGVDIDTINNMLQAQNLNMPAGSITDNETDYLVRIPGKFDSLEEIKNLTLASAQKGIFKLSDVADVQIKTNDLDSYSKVNGENSITVSIQKQSEYNTSDVAKDVTAEIENIKEEYSDINITTILDQSEYINSMVNSVSLNGLIGAILAILILLLFLRDLRPTFVIGVAIPISVIATFTLIYFFDITLNVISLGGLALGIGMLVDNSIVVLENIYRFRSKGYSYKKAAIKGSTQIAGAITASTLTTVSVFLPIVFVQGVTAQLFKEMALTVSMSLLASLFIALTLVPMMSSQVLKRRETVKEGKIITGIKNSYSKILSFSLKHKVLVVILTLIVFAGSIYGVLNTGTEFLPASDQGQISIDVSMPKGTTYSQTVEAVSEVEDILLDFDEIETVSAQVQGSGSGGMMSLFSGGSNSGSINVVLVPQSERKNTTSEIANTIRDSVKDINADISVTSQSSNMMMGLTEAVSIEIQGSDLAKLEIISNDLVDILDEVEGVVDIESSISKGSPELKIVVDSMKATPMGLTNAQIYGVINKAVNGTSSTTISINNKELDVKIIKSKYENINIEDIKALTITSPVTNSQIPLSSIANIEKDTGYTSIERKNGSRLVTISAGSDGTLSTGEIASSIEDKLDSYDLPEGYFINVAGENEQITDAFSDLYLALLLAVVLVYMVMAAQFESFIHPFTIMFTVPLAFTGAFLALTITNTALSVPAMIGMIVLAGIVVNNGIVLVDYINKQRQSGKDKYEAIMYAGPIRLKPILMTALTTILALLPLSLGIGEGAELEAPLAIAVIGGLILSTLLTLVVLPVIYSIFDKFSTKSHQEEIEV